MSGLPAAGRDGIKALILYPMNALASDQAGRIARSINDDRRLAGVRIAGRKGQRCVGECHHTGIWMHAQVIRRTAAT